MSINSLINNPQAIVNDVINHHYASRFNPYRPAGPIPYTGGVPIFRISIIDGKDNSIIKKTYTFPISPSLYNKEFVSLSTAYNTAASGFLGGVKRIIDQYGITPPVWKFKGSTGFKYHALDNYQYTGNQSLKILVDIITQYAKDQAVNTANNSPLDIMELNDYFDNDHWYVVPVGNQGIMRGANAPLWGYYDLVFFGMTPAGAGNTSQSYFLQDLVFAALSESIETLLSRLANLGQEIQSTYSAIGIP